LRPGRRRPARIPAGQRQDLVEHRGAPYLDRLGEPLVLAEQFRVRRDGPQGGGRGRLADRVRLARGGGEVPAVQHHLGEGERGDVGGGHGRPHHVERALPGGRVGPGGQRAVELRPVAGGEAGVGGEVAVDQVLVDGFA